jgi:hypothetical protein
MITRESIQDRKQVLERQRDELIANFHAVLGAIQDCEWWLEQLGEDEE